jgi:hypothetical protein
MNRECWQPAGTADIVPGMALVVGRARRAA